MCCLFSFNPHHFARYLIFLELTLAKYFIQKRKKQIYFHHTGIILGGEGDRPFGGVHFEGIFRTLTMTTACDAFAASLQHYLAESHPAQFYFIFLQWENNLMVMISRKNKFI